MAKSRIFAALICFSALSACASAPPVAVQTRLPDVSTPDPEPVVTQAYTWKAYNSSDIATLNAALAKHPNKNFVIFAMTPSGYKKMTGNYIELQRYIKEQKATIVYLKKELSDRAQDPAAEPAK